LIFGRRLLKKSGEELRVVGEEGSPGAGLLCLRVGAGIPLLLQEINGSLRYLVAHAGRLVTQEELLDAIWPGVYVQPEVLQRHMFEIRSVLGDNPKNPGYIETLPRRGYRFIARVRDLASPDPVERALLPASLGLLHNRQT
jgi:hypothetical protein